MIANFFNKTKPINFLVLSILMFMAYVISIIFFFPEEISVAFFIKKGFYLVLVVFMLFILDFIIRKNALTEDNSFALWFYVLLFGFFPFSFGNTEMLVANFFLLLSFRKIYSLRTSLNTKEKIFDSAMWIGVACLFYDWSFIYLILLYAAIILFHKNEWRNTVIPLIGFFTPIFLLYVYFLVTNETNILNEFWHFEYKINFENYLQNNFLYPLVFILILSILSIIPTTKKSFSAKQDFKSTWTVIIFQLLVSFVIVIISPLKNGSELSFLFFPLCILFANYIQDIKKFWIKEVISFLFLIVYFSVYII